MELSIVRGILTLILMLSFITLVVWLYARQHRDAYAAAALLPLEEDDAVAATTPSSLLTSLSISESISESNSQLVSKTGQSS